MTDPIADMLTRIRNAVLASKAEVVIPFSRMKFEIGKILEREGFIIKSEKIDQPNKSGPKLRIFLKYKDNEPIIRGIKRISKSGQRVYQGYKEIPKVIPSLGVLIISTSRGLMTNADAKKKKIGGEVLCEIY